MYRSFLFPIPIYKIGKIFALISSNISTILFSDLGLCHNTGRRCLGHADILLLFYNDNCTVTESHYEKLISLQNLQSDLWIPENGLQTVKFLVLSYQGNVYGFYWISQNILFKVKANCWILHYPLFKKKSSKLTWNLCTSRQHRSYLDVLLWITHKSEPFPVVPRIRKYYAVGKTGH